MTHHLPPPISFSADPASGGHRRLIPAWRAAGRLWSIRLAAAGATLMAAWPSLPGEVRALLPHADRLAALLFIAVALARIVAQEKPR